MAAEPSDSRHIVWCACYFMQSYLNGSCDIEWNYHTIFDKIILFDGNGKERRRKGLSVSVKV